MLDKRRWKILKFISDEKPIDEIVPPLEGTEVRYYKENREYYERMKKELKPGLKFQFVPPDDPDYDEGDEPWPPVYED